MFAAIYVPPVFLYCPFTKKFFLSQIVRIISLVFSDYFRSVVSPPKSKQQLFTNSGNNMCVFFIYTCMQRVHVKHNVPILYFYLNVFHFVSDYGELSALWFLESYMVKKYRKAFVCRMFHSMVVTPKK